MENDAPFRPFRLFDLAQILALAGARDQAVAVLEELWELPNYLCPKIVAEDPVFAGLRGQARFDALLEREMRRF